MGRRNKTDISRILPAIRAEECTSEDEQLVAELLDYMNQTGGNTDVLDDMFLCDYEEKPVTPHEFLNSPFYMGSFVKALYPKWKEELLYILDPKNAINEWVVYGSIGTGKTSAACVAQLYKLYWLTCMKSPQKLFGLAPLFPVYFAFSS